MDWSPHQALVYLLCTAKSAGLLAIFSSYFNFLVE